MSRIAWNKQRHSTDTIKQIQSAVDAEPDGVWGSATQHAVEQWQLDHGLEPDGKVGPRTLEAMLADDGTPISQEWRPLDDEEVDKIIAGTIAVESAGRSNPYAAANLNAEYEGWFDRPKRDENNKRLKPHERALRDDHEPHKASKYGKTPSMIGLSHGPIQTTQDGGALGKVLRYWFDEEPEVFAAVFGEAHKKMLLTVTTEGKSGFSQDKLRGPRVKPIEGADLWQSPWVQRFADAAEKLGYQRAQRRVMREDYFEPAIKICKEYEHSSQGALAVAFDCCVQYGPGGARRRFKRAGKNASILAVLKVLEEGGTRARQRREEILGHCEPFVHYEDLVTC